MSLASLRDSVIEGIWRMFWHKPVTCRRVLYQTYNLWSLRFPHSNLLRFVPNYFTLNNFFCFLATDKDVEDLGLRHRLNCTRSRTSFNWIFTTVCCHLKGDRFNVLMGHQRGKTLCHQRADESDGNAQGELNLISASLFELERSSFSN